ncbi:MAG: hypothetical protein ACRDRL_06690 [Sciscionella sp.]
MAERGAALPAGRRMRGPLGIAKAFYGDHPLHLIALLACFALAGYVVLQVIGNPSLPRILLWFAGAIIAHDLIAFPIYAAIDRVTNHFSAGQAMARFRLPVINYLRLPALASVLLLLLFLPDIIEQGVATFHNATGLTQAPYLGRWLLLVAALFVLSAVVYAVRYFRLRIRAGHGGDRGARASRRPVGATAAAASRTTGPHQARQAGEIPAAPGPDGPPSAPQSGLASDTELAPAVRFGLGTAFLACCAVRVLLPRWRHARAPRRRRRGGR